MLFRSGRVVHRRGGWGQQKLEGIETEADFARVLLRERDRADRTQDVFSLVTLVVDEEQCRDADWCRALGRIVRARLRSTDDTGWLPHFRLGISLPHTSVDGAWVLVADLREKLERKSTKYSPLRFSVYTHIGDRGGEGDHHHHNGSGKKHPRGDTLVLREGSASALEALLLQPPGLGKRALDIALAGVGLVLTSPVLATAAVAIKLSSKGQVFFRQERAGFAGRPFTFYKLRTMVDGAEQIKDSLADLNEADGPVFKIRRDPRVTLVGRILRKTSIDELPQLWNVLRGDMSLVGPRPPTLDEVGKYESWQRRRLLGMGGLTCLWQVGGRSDIPFLDWMRLDLRYLRQQSLASDLVLILRTIPAVLLCRGAK